MEAILNDWPDVPAGAYADVDCAADRFWVRCLGRVVAGLTRRTDWAAARAAGGDKWIPRVATRRARVYGSIENAPEWLKQLEALGRSPDAARRRGEVRRSISRFRTSQWTPTCPRRLGKQAHHQLLAHK